METKSKSYNKSYLLVVVCIVSALCISANSSEVPPEFKNCDKENFSFNDLKYYNQKELVEGYCACKLSAKYNEELESLARQKQIPIIQLYGVGSRQYRDGEMQQKEYSNKKDTANGNASRILRILQKDHKYKDTPKCGTE
jgi:hypothetical protein